MMQEYICNSCGERFFNTIVVCSGIFTGCPKCYSSSLSVPTNAINAGFYQVRAGSFSGTFMVGVSYSGLPISVRLPPVMHGCPPYDAPLSFTDVGVARCFAAALNLGMKEVVK